MAGFECSGGLFPGLIFSPLYLPCCTAAFPMLEGQSWLSVFRALSMFPFWNLLCSNCFDNNRATLHRFMVKDRLPLNILFCVLFLSSQVQALHFSPWLLLNTELTLLGAYNSPRSSSWSGQFLWHVKHLFLCVPLCLSELNFAFLLPINLVTWALSASWPHFYLLQRINWKAAVS